MKKQLIPSDTINMELLKKLKLINKNSQKLKDTWNWRD